MKRGVYNFCTWYTKRRSHLWFTFGLYLVSLVGLMFTGNALLFFCVGFGLPPLLIILLSVCNTINSYNAETFFANKVITILLTDEFFSCYLFRVPFVILFGYIADLFSLTLMEGSVIKRVVYFLILFLVIWVNDKIATLISKHCKKKIVYIETENKLSEV